MNHIEIKNKLASGKFDFLIGLFEDEHLEAKSGKYDLLKKSGKQELAKDVSSFANKSGGLIVICVQTIKDKINRDKIKSVSTFPSDLINKTDYYNIIDVWLYPQPKDIEIEWIPSDVDITKGIVYIFIPKQPENLLPFLIKKNIESTTNRKCKEILFGYVERISHNSKPASIEYFHTMLRLGREISWKEKLERELKEDIERKLSIIDGGEW